MKRFLAGYSAPFSEQFRLLSSDIVVNIVKCNTV